MISAILGKPGNGKTLEAVRRALLAHNTGLFHVYANIPLDLERFTLITPESLATVRRGECDCGCEEVFVLLDEVHLWLPARRSMRLPTSWLALFSQTRKMGWELWWTAQHETRVDRMLRDVTTFFYLARGRSWPFESYQYDMYDPEHFRDERYRLRKDVRRRSRSACAVYDTYGAVTGATHVQDARDPYAVPVASRERAAGEAATRPRPTVPAAEPAPDHDGPVPRGPRPSLDPSIRRF